MKLFFALVMMTASCSILVGQEQTRSDDSQEIEKQSLKFGQAKLLFEDGKHEDAFKLLHELIKSSETADTIRDDARWALAGSLSTLARKASLGEDWKTSCQYAEEYLNSLEETVENTTDEELRSQAASRQFWAFKNLVVAHHGLEQLHEANAYMEKLREGYKNKTLPDGIDKYFNFEFFRHDGYNVWGYENYPNLGDPETEGSYPKINYFIYSANEDGSDKESLFRLAVLKFHKIEASDPLDFVLTGYVDDKLGGGSKTLYDFTYNSPLEMKKVRSDVRKFLNENWTSIAEGIELRKKEGVTQNKDDK